MDVIGSHSQFQNRPALLVALPTKQTFTADEVIGSQMDMVFIALVVQVARIVAPVATLPQYL